MKQLLTEYDKNIPVSQQMSEVIGEYGTGRYKTVLIHVFSGIADEEKLTGLCRELGECCGTDLIVGTMSAGEIMDGHMIEWGILISAMLFESSDAEILRFDDVKGNEVQTGIRVREALDAIPGLKCAEILFPGTEMDTEHMFEEISRCRRDIKIFGGYPGGHRLNAPEHFIFDVGGAMFNSMVVITYSGENLHFNMDKSIGWVPLGMPFKVTKAQGKHLIELDGRPAAEVYEKFLRIDRKEHLNADDAMGFPLMARQNGEDRLRSVIFIEEDGSLRLHGFVKNGMDINLTYGDPTRIVDTVNRRLEAMRQFKPQAILLYSCVVRKSFWEDFVDMEMLPFAKIASTAGFHTWGEIMRNERTGEMGENNITLLSIGMREGDAPEAELPPVRIDDTVLQGQASVLRRLTRLVETTMEELQKAHNQMKRMAERDSLTGLYNRGMMERFIDEALEGKHTVSMSMLDLDYFKRVNDNFGHDAGDMALREMAAIMTEAVKPHEGARVGRWGGEEFFILLPNLGKDETAELAEQIRFAVDTHDFSHVGHLTVSQGIITVNCPADKKPVYKAVDAALYRAKAAGRNRTEGATIL